MSFSELEIIFQRAGTLKLLAAQQSGILPNQRLVTIWKASSPLRAPYLMPVLESGHPVM